MMKKLIFTLLPVLLISCSALERAYYDSFQVFESAGLISKQSVRRSGQWVLSANSSFYVAVNPELAEISPELAMELSSMLKLSVDGRFAQSRAATEAESVDLAVANAQLRGIDYILYPRVLVWDDNISTWTHLGQTLRDKNTQQIITSFGLDKVSLQLMIMESSTRRLVDLARLDAEGGLLTLYEDKPSWLIKPAVDDYFDTLVNY